MTEEDFIEQALPAGQAFVDDSTLKNDTVNQIKHLLETNPDYLMAH